MEDINIENRDSLLAYLRQHRHIRSEEEPAMEILPGGVSNRTVRLDRATGESWVLKQALEKLRVAVDWFSSPARIHREALGLRWLNHVAVPGTVPTLVFEDHDYHILAMEAVPRPHHNWKALLLAGVLDFDHVRQFGRLLGMIHRRGAHESCQTANIFDDRTFFESLRLEPYYSYTAQQVPEAAAFIESLVAETRAHRLTVVHGDFSPKNVLVYQNQLVLLDYEVIHFGDPAFDLGFSLTHFLSKAHHLDPLRDRFLQAALIYWETYCEAMDERKWIEGVRERVVRHTLACLLARVEGRSPLEYLSVPERKQQRKASVGLIKHQPQTVQELIERFALELE